MYRFSLLRPNIFWFQDYGGTGEESAFHFILSCDDGGFLQVGEHTIIQIVKSIIVKTNENGVLDWNREIGIGDHNLGKRF